MATPIDPDLIKAAKDAVIAGTSILCSREILMKVFGPTADLIGDSLKNYSKRALGNLGNIIRIAITKMKNRADVSGEIPPKVIKSFLLEGPFVEDEIAAEYFGGVLASSKSNNSRDDRGAVCINLLSSLSSYQIRTHYILYFLLRKTFLNYNNVISPGTNRDLMYIYIPTESYYESMDLGFEFPDEERRLSILAHSMNGMKRLNLVEVFKYGKKAIFDQQDTKYKFPQFPIDEKQLSSHGITSEPSPFGMELFLWAHGLGHVPHQQFLSNDFVISPLEGIKLPQDVSILYRKLVEALQKTSLGKGMVNKEL